MSYQLQYCIVVQVVVVKVIQVVAAITVVIFKYEYHLNTLLASYIKQYLVLCKSFYQAFPRRGPFRTAVHPEDRRGSRGRNNNRRE